MLRTTKIVVEESGSPEVCSTFTLPNYSQKSEISVEEVDSFLLNEENVIQEINDSNRNFEKDQKSSTVEKSDMDDLMERIQKQRNALDDMLSKDKLQKQVSEEINVETEKIEESKNNTEEIKTEIEKVEVKESTIETEEIKLSSDSNQNLRENIISNSEKPENTIIESETHPEGRTSTFYRNLMIEVRNLLNLSFTYIETLNFLASMLYSTFFPSHNC